MGLMDNFKKKRDEKKAAKAARKASVDANLGRYRFIWGGVERDISKLTGDNSRIRSMMDDQYAKLIDTYGDLVHPETGERPDVHFVLPKGVSTKMEMRVVTDSPVLREWLAAKGLAVHGEIVEGIGRREPAEHGVA